jgi:hypothetical protein
LITPPLFLSSRALSAVPVCVCLHLLSFICFLSHGFFNLFRFTITLTVVYDRSVSSRAVAMSFRGRIVPSFARRHGCICRSAPAGWTTPIPFSWSSPFLPRTPQTDFSMQNYEFHNSLWSQKYNCTLCSSVSLLILLLLGP